MNIIDIFILGIIALGALQGYRRGLITGIANFAGSIVGFLIASTQYLKALTWAEQRFPLKQWVEPFVYNMVKPAVQARAGNLNQQIIDKVISLIPPNVLSLLGNASSLNINNLAKGGVDTIAHSIAGILTEDILRVLAFGILYYFTVLLIQFLVGILLKPLGIFGGTLNRGGGFVFGALGSLIALAVLAGLFSPVLQLGKNGTLATLIDQSLFYPFLLQVFNMLDSLFKVQLKEKLLQPFDLELYKQYITKNL